MLNKSLVALAVFLVLASLSFAAAPAPAQAQAKFEIRFMTDMIDHHHMAVMMAEMCMEKATHDELRAMCQEIMTTQMAEIEMMQGWLADWYGIHHEPEMKMMKGQMDKLHRLEGAAFEIAFMEMMIRHHYGAIIEAYQCERRAYHEELKALCHNIIETQMEEIRKMREWLCEWYGVCHYGPKGRM